MKPVSVYEAVMGTHYARMASALQRFHRLSGQHTLHGEAVDGARSWQHTAAMLRVAHALGWLWRLAWVGWLVPNSAARFLD